MFMRSGHSGSVARLISLWLACAQLLLWPALSSPQSQEEGEGCPCVKASAPTSPEQGLTRAPCCHVAPSESSPLPGHDKMPVPPQSSQRDLLTDLPPASITLPHGQRPTRRPSPALHLAPETCRASLQARNCTWLI